MNLVGIVYIHEITQARRPRLDNLRIAKKICNNDVKKIAFVTTKWKGVVANVTDQRVRDLKDILLKNELNVPVIRFEDTPKSALEIINNLLRNKPVDLKCVQKELGALAQWDKRSKREKRPSWWEHLIVILRRKLLGR
jgi:hypothetical protein